jgi:PEGA domain
MNGRKLSLALSLAMVAYPAWAADRAQPRSGGGGAHGSGHSSGSHSSGGHSSGGHSSGSSHSGSGYSGSSYSGGGSSSGHSGYRAVRRGSGGSYAGARHPSGGTGRYYRGRYYSRPYYGYGYYPYYYGGYYSYDPYFYFYGGYYPYYGGGYYYSRPYEPSYGYSAPQGSLRLLVDPESTRVYVDGYYSGVVDDYNGLFQRLYLPMGKHVIVLRLDGYESQSLKVYVSPGETLKIHYTMERGSGDSPKELVFGDPGVEKYPPRLRDEDADDDRTVDDSDDGDRADDAPPAHMSMSQPDRGQSMATLRLGITPDDASVYVDGRFYGTAREARRVEVAPGQHKIEAVRPGYRTFEKDVEVAADGTTSLDVALER